LLSKDNKKNVAPAPSPAKELPVTAVLHVILRCEWKRRRDAFHFPALHL
jgi:hypothetical protein